MNEVSTLSKIFFPISFHKKTIPIVRLFVLDNSFMKFISKELLHDENIEINLISTNTNYKDISLSISLYNDSTNYILTDSASIQNLLNEDKKNRKNVFKKAFIMNSLNTPLSNPKIHYVNNSTFNDIFYETVFKKTQIKPYVLKEWCGDLNGVEDCVIIGAGISGILLAKAIGNSVRSILILEKSDKIGGVWKQYANDNSRAYSCEPLYHLKNKRVQYKNNCTKEEIIDDLQSIVSSFPNHIKIMTKSNINSIFDDGKGEVISFTKDGNEHKVKAKRVFLCINDSIEDITRKEFKNESLFEGQIYYGSCNETNNLKWINKKVVIVGSDSTAISMTESALRGGAHSVTLLSRNDNNIVYPEIVEYLQNIRPMNNEFETKQTGTNTILDNWNNLNKLTGLPQIDDKTLKEGTVIYTSDIWYIGHYYGTIKSFNEDLSEINSRHIITTSGMKVECDIIIKCLGFHKTNNIEHISGSKNISENGVIRENLMLLNDTRIFHKNTRSYIQTLNLICSYIKNKLKEDSPIKPEGKIEHLESYEKLSINEFILQNSKNIDVSTTLLETIINFHDRYSPTQFLYHNIAKWERLCNLINIRAISRKETDLSYTFKDILSSLYTEWFDIEQSIGNLESLRTDDNIYDTNLEWCLDSKRKDELKIELLGNSIEIKDDDRELEQVSAILNSYEYQEHDISGCFIDSSGYDISGYVINKLENFKITAESLIPQEYKDQGNNKFEWNLQKDGARYFSYAFWRVCYIGKTLLRKLPSFEVSKFDLEYGAVMQTLYSRLSYDVTTERTPYIIIAAVRQAILYHTILKTVSDNITITYSIYECDCTHSYLPPIKLNFDQRIAMFDFHIYYDKVILNSNFDHTFFDVSTIHLFYKTVDDYLYNSGQNLPVSLTIMYNPTKFDTEYFTNFSNTWIDQVANMILSSVSGVIHTQSKLEISTNTISIIRQSLEKSNIILSNYRVLCFLYTLFIFEVFQHRMKETDTFCVIDGEYVRNEFGSNSLGNFIFFQGPHVLTISDFTSKSMLELLTWWSTGFSTFDKDIVRTPISDGTFRLSFQDWTMLSDLTTKMYYESITVFPFGEHHIDCSNSKKIDLNIINQNDYYCLNIPIQCAGIDMKTCWDKVLCSL